MADPQPPFELPPIEFRCTALVTCRELRRDEANRLVLWGVTNEFPAPASAPLEIPVFVQITGLVGPAMILVEIREPGFKILDPPVARRDISVKKHRQQVVHNQTTVLRVGRPRPGRYILRVLGERHELATAPLIISLDRLN